MWQGFTPLEPATFTIPTRAHDFLAEPVGFRLTGEELLGCGLWPGDLLIVDVEDRDPAPGALVVVWGHEHDPDPARQDHPSLADLSSALREKIRPVRPVPIVGQFWPTSRGEGREYIDIRAVLPGFPAPVGILDYALDDLLVGVVHGYYGTSEVRGRAAGNAIRERYDWSGWDFDKEIWAARERMRVQDALTDPA